LAEAMQTRAKTTSIKIYTAHFLNFLTSIMLSMVLLGKLSYKTFLKPIVYLDLKLDTA